MIEKVTWIFDGTKKVRKDKIVSYRPGYESWNEDACLLQLDGVNDEITFDITFERMCEIMEG